jgi:hypothetical protein
MSKLTPDIGCLVADVRARASTMRRSGCSKCARVDRHLRTVRGLIRVSSAPFGGIQCLGVPKELPPDRQSALARRDVENWQVWTRERSVFALFLYTGLRASNIAKIRRQGRAGQDKG